MDWRKLAPHRPLSPDDVHYVARPGQGGDRLAAMVLAGASPVFVVGPAGIGKSTELNRAVAKLRQGGAFVLHLALDTTEDMEALDARELMFAIGKAAYRTWPSDTIEQVLETKGHAAVNASTARPIVDYAIARLRAAAERVRKTQAILTLDGLEKVRHGERLAGIMAALAQLAHEVELVAVVPWDLLLGLGGTEPLPGWSPSPFVLEAIAGFTDNNRGLPIPDGLRFFEHLLLSRLSIRALPDSAEATLVFHRAVRFSGGVPRTFLQIMRDAGVYAAIERNQDWPSVRDVDDAIASQVLTLRRLVTQADLRVLNGVTAGAAAPASPEVLRLLHTGMLVELGGRRVITPLGEAVAKAGPL